VKVYPDTTVWIKDYAYSYNSHIDYFWHKAYGDYPVVGCKVDTSKLLSMENFEKIHTSNQKEGRDFVNVFRLPTKQNGIFSKRWFRICGIGGPYTKTIEVLLANFKPNRGDYAADDALYTVEAKSYEQMVITCIICGMLLNGLTSYDQTLMNTFHQ
jgi:hypothetical protein